MRCQARTHSGGFYNSQCENQSKNTVEGEFVDYRGNPTVDHTTYLCGLHMRKLNQRGRIDVYVDNKDSGHWRDRPVKMFRAKDQSIYLAKLWQDRYESARSSAYFRVRDREKGIEYEAKQGLPSFIDLIVDGTPIPHDVAQQLRANILDARKELAIAQQDYDRLCTMDAEQYRLEKEQTS